MLRSSSLRRMTLPSSRLLDPATLAGIKDLRLVAKTVVEGFLSGLHVDPRPSAGAEFSQYRSYGPGDDPRRVDWRVYARSDRFFVREAETERDVTIRIVIDASASMAQGGGPGAAIGTGVKPGALSAFDYARFAAAALAYLVTHQGDALALHAVTAGGVVDVDDRRREHALKRSLDLLEDLEPAGEWPALDTLLPHVARRRGRQLVLLLSDLWERGDEIRKAVLALRALRHEVLVLHVLSRSDLAFPYEGDALFEDRESGEVLVGNADRLRAGYLARLETWLEDWKRTLLEAGVAYQLLPADEPLDQALRSFLQRRRLLP